MYNAGGSLHTPGLDLSPGWRLRCEAPQGADVAPVRRVAVGRRETGTTFGTHVRRHKRHRRPLRAAPTWCVIITRMRRLWSLAFDSTVARASLGPRLVRALAAGTALMVLVAAILFRPAPRPLRNLVIVSL